MLLQSGRWGGTPSLSPTPSVAPKKTKKMPEPTALSDDELRRRIFANAAVLFPSSSSQNNAYEVVYGTRPRSIRDSTSPSPSLNPSTADSEGSAWQYAMLVRRSPSGEYTPLMRGQACSNAVPWAMTLQALLDSTATAIHKKFGNREMPPLGFQEELPRYSLSGTGASRTVTQ